MATVQSCLWEFWLVSKLHCRFGWFLGLLTWPVLLKVKNFMNRRFSAIVNQSCPILNNINVISSKFINKFVQKCQCNYTFSDQSIPLVTVISVVSLLTEQLWAYINTYSCKQCCIEIRFFKLFCKTTLQLAKLSLQDITQFQNFICTPFWTFSVFW